MEQKMITRQDTLRHTPSAGESAWQESFFLCWADVRNRSAFHCHLSLAPQLQKAHLWAWLIVDGEEIARSREHALSLPTADFDDISLGAVRFRAGDSLRKLTCTAKIEDAEVEVEFRAFTDPVSLDFNASSLQLGNGHYESMGRVTGTVRHSGRSVAIDGWGWHDHSWGIRRFKSNPAGRWIFAAFGEDLAFSAFSLATAAGKVQMGYVLDQGSLHPIVAFDAGVRLSDDGSTPVSADSKIWTSSGRGYRLKAEVIAAALVGGPGWSDDSVLLATDGLAQFECGGRLGGGLVEVANHRDITAEQRERLGL